MYIPDPNLFFTCDLTAVDPFDRDAWRTGILHSLVLPLSHWMGHGQHLNIKGGIWRDGWILLADSIEIAQSCDTLNVNQWNFSRPQSWCGDKFHVVTCTKHYHFLPCSCSECFPCHFRRYIYAQNLENKGKFVCLIWASNMINTQKIVSAKWVKLISVIKFKNIWDHFTKLVVSYNRSRSQTFGVPMHDEAMRSWARRLGHMTWLNHFQLYSAILIPRTLIP